MTNPKQLILHPRDRISKTPGHRDGSPCFLKPILVIKVCVSVFMCTCIHACSSPYPIQLQLSALHTQIEKGSCLSLNASFGLMVQHQITIVTNDNFRGEQKPGPTPTQKIFYSCNTKCFKVFLQKVQNKRYEYNNAIVHFL